MAVVEIAETTITRSSTSQAKSSGVSAPTGEPFKGFVGNRKQLYAPFFLIDANGQLASDIARDVSDFSYIDDEKKSNQLKLVVNNKGLKYSDDPRLAEGATFRVRWGYVNNLSDTKFAVITKAKPNFASGVPTIEMIAFDVRQEANRGSRPKNWGAVQSSDIAVRIAKDYGMTTDIEDSKDARKEHRVQRASVTDIQFLKQLAEKINWDCYVDNKTLHFHPKRFSEAPEFIFDYYVGGSPTILSFEPEVKMNKPGKTGVAGVDPRTGNTNTATSATGDKKESPNAKTGFFDINTEHGTGTAVRTPINPIIGSCPESNQQVIKQLANAHQAKIDSSAIVAHAVLVGVPTLRAKHNIKIRGVGRMYSGVWRVTEAHHQIKPSGQSYTVHCKLARNAIGKGKGSDAVSANSANNKDPNGKGKQNTVFIVDTEQGRGNAQ